ncbi:putative amidase [Pleomassaria siparia CBS 279.74]|uniref:Putative amidase n=1 Tax=Pleomassaria siparia CBS 279.74 TaxID=1314801 RepID=A0A6G1JRI5_9PLEO|nr:putative amidase [Pleomassaria siparia CBS 279.74]
MQLTMQSDWTRNVKLATFTRADRANNRNLHGVPILLKETFNTLDKMDTTGGSLALKGARPSKEAHVVKALRSAGAVILGKTTITQWSNTRAAKAPNGWTSVYGQCYGAFHAKQDPQGSSSGAAVAASLDLAAATLGAETWGSIVYPAQRSAVVGIKPTVGLVSRAGVIPVSTHKDTIGPVTRSVKDGAIILNVLAGRDEDDETTGSIPFGSIPDYTKACDKHALEGARIAISESALRTVTDEDVLDSFQKAVDLIASMGATVIRDVDFKEFDPEGHQRENLSFNVMLREGLESYFDQLKVNPHGIHTLADLVTFMERTPEEQVERYGIEGFTDARDEPYTSESPEFKDAVARMKHLGADIERLLDVTQCDAIVAPTSADLPFDLGQNPVVTVPLGFYPKDRKVVRALDSMVAKANNVPYSLSFVGKRFSEETLIGLAYAFEQATLVGERARPCVHSSVELIFNVAGEGDAKL